MPLVQVFILVLVLEVWELLGDSRLGERDLAQARDSVLFPGIFLGLSPERDGARLSEREVLPQDESRLGEKMSPERENVARARASTSQVRIGYYFRKQKKRNDWESCAPLESRKRPEKSFGLKDHKEVLDNTSRHSSTKMTQFQALYCRRPLPIIDYTSGRAINTELDLSLQQRQNTVARRVSPKLKKGFFGPFPTFGLHGSLRVDSTRRVTNPPNFSCFEASTLLEYTSGEHLFNLVT
ncbi:hypothetical protein Lal_00041692 [Lupinus albus]|nr:hypothetical protein Lal_00041692 [Lupinus albus]